VPLEATTPIFKGIAQAPTDLQAAFLSALAAVDSTVIQMTPAASGAAGAFDVRCQPGYYGAPLLGVTTLTAAAATSALATLCSPCATAAAAASPATNAALVAVGSLLEKVRGESTNPPCDEDVGESGDGAKPESESADAG
jgi:hypothetical protein